MALTANPDAVVHFCAPAVVRRRARAKPNRAAADKRCMRRVHGLLGSCLIAVVWPRRPRAPRRRSTASSTSTPPRSASSGLLPGIGPAKAAQIVAYRRRHPFRTVDELVRIRGIGRKMVRRLRVHLAVSGPDHRDRRRRAGGRAAAPPPPGATTAAAAPTRPRPLCATSGPVPAEARAAADARHLLGARRAQSRSQGARSVPLPRRSPWARRCPGAGSHGSSRSLSSRRTTYDSDAALS